MYKQRLARSCGHDKSYFPFEKCLRRRAQLLVHSKSRCPKVEGEKMNEFKEISGFNADSSSGWRPPTAGVNSFHSVRTTEYFSLSQQVARLENEARLSDVVFLV